MNVARSFGFLPSIKTALLTSAFLMMVSGPCSAGSQQAPKLAPDFVRRDLHHARIRLGHFRGKVVLLNFWATWCAPCLVEMPQFVAWQSQYGADGLQVLGVSMDDDDVQVRKLEQKLHLNFPIMMGDERLGELYGGVFGLPVTLLIDRKGLVRERFEGATEPGLIKARIKELLLTSVAHSRG